MAGNIDSLLGSCKVRIQDCTFDTRPYVASREKSTEPPRAQARARARPLSRLQVDVGAIAHLPELAPGATWRLQPETRMKAADYFGDSVDRAARKGPSPRVPACRARTIANSHLASSSNSSR